MSSFIDALLLNPTPCKTPKQPLFPRIFLTAFDEDWIADRWRNAVGSSSNFVSFANSQRTLQN